MCGGVCFGGVGFLCVFSCFGGNIISMPMNSQGSPAGHKRHNSILERATYLKTSNEYARGHSFAAVL